MEFCDFDCREPISKRCGRCGKKFCYKHGGTIEVRFKVYPHLPRYASQDSNILRSILVLRGEQSETSLGRGGATYRYFFEQVLPRIVFPDDCLGDFCSDCLKFYREYYLQELEKGFFRILRWAQTEGLICEVHELCFMDVHKKDLLCSFCGKRGCYNHAQYCSSGFCDKVVVCSSSLCRAEHCGKHPYKGNRTLVGLDQMVL